MAVGTDLCVMPIVKPEVPDESEENQALSNLERIEASENLSDQNFAVEANYIAKKGKIIIQKPRDQDQLRNKGFGENFNKEYLLSYLEALFLLQNNKLKVSDKTKDYDFSEFLKVLVKKDKKLLTKFLIYRDVRSKGYVLKDGFGFGTDFRIYERGEFNKKTSKYVAIGLNEGTTINASSFANMVEEVEKMGKNAVIAVVERRGEVIYYKASKMNFSENKRVRKKDSESTFT